MHALDGHPALANRGGAALHRAAVRIRVKNTQIDDSATDCLGGGEDRKKNVRLAPDSALNQRATPLEGLARLLVSASSRICARREMG